jgi:REP element-mobilizing transposase RayT
MAFSKIFLHVTWHTKENVPCINDEVGKLVYDVIRKKCIETEGVIILALGGTEDHIHLAMRISPGLSVGKFIGELKGATSYFVKKDLKLDDFYWQEGYGAVSFRESDLEKITKYIDNQKRHHDAGKLSKDLEKTE